MSGYPSQTNSIVGVACFDETKTKIGDAVINGYSFTTLPNTKYIYILLGSSVGFQNATFNSANMQVEFGTTVHTKEDYKEPVTTSLPILDYFPSGMKSAGSVYDEFSDSKVVTRLRKTIVDGTNVLASYYGTYLGHQLFYVDLGSSQNITADPLNLLTNKYAASNQADMGDKQCRYQGTPGTVINPNRIYWNDDAYSSANAMNTALQSSPLEIISLLVNPTEITSYTASLITQGQEISMSAEDDKLVAYSTEAITENSGFHDCKIKLTDSDGNVAYSTRFRLHTERKP